MKKFLLPGALVLAGLLFIGMSFFNFGKDALSVKISNASYIMPSVYKVYANPEALNGEYYFFKMLMTNNGNASMQDVKVSYDIPGYIDWTELQTIPVIYPGQHVVIRCYPHFKDDIVKKMTQSQETGEIKIEYNGGKTKKETFTFNMMGRNQFVYTDIPADEVTSYPDMMHNTQLLPCLVTPEDPIVKYYTSQVQDKFMQGEAASVENDPQKAMQGAKDFLVKLYAATVASKMVYSGTEGIPQKMGDISSTVQSARLPREVVTGNTGLCIELSLLYASVLKAAGLHPVIFLIPGHAFPGVLINNYYFAIEATGVGGQGLGGTMTPEQAFEKGSQELATFIDGYQKGDTRNIVIDINDLEAKGVIPMELSDDEFLRKKVDDIAATFGGGGTSHTTVVVNNDRREGNNEHRTNNNSGSGMRSYSGSISFSYPAGWQRSGNYPVPQINTLVSRIVAPDQQAGISAWDIPASSPDQALYILRNQLAALGQYITYQRVNQANGYSMYQGSTSYNGGTFRWEGVFRSGGNGIVGITMGGTNFNGYQGVFNSIITTIR
ncbi:hypothetical protein [Mucilaginibacter ginsenosidivorans]|uniref:Transglutaminase domain-containing protein n=1 Tax=Mucilaginibacter ginsenosidivorans TaxID=398053 RepID=A0A5B8UX47_9SPHI|nr:hypothetical protein [Mucilaginibacter ginsenosidivorans]QEC63509.1 hypothetical protein FRZ54_13280 [Mucilaginibacter ginsenosidivorans]